MLLTLLTRTQPPSAFRSAYCFCLMCLTAFEFILLYVLIIGLWINNWFFFQAITAAPKHSVCVTTPLNYEGYETTFWIQRKFEWTEIYSCSRAQNSRFRSSHTMSNIFLVWTVWFTLWSNQWSDSCWLDRQRAAAGSCLGMRQEDGAPSALLGATPDKIKTQGGESPFHSCLFSLLLRKPLLGQDCM